MIPAAYGPGALRNAVDLARRAPSVHNTQPWTWRAHGGLLELWADRDRQLLASDPRGRNLVISCGAVLHHVREAGRSLGVGFVVDRLPDARQPDLLAVLRPVAAPRPDDAAARLHAIQTRRTDRRRFTSWPVPPARVARLAATARHLGADVVPVGDIALRCRLETLVEEAAAEQGQDLAVAAEQLGWMDHEVGDGVPSGVLPDTRGQRGHRATRFDPPGPTKPPAPGPTHEAVLTGTDGMLVLATAYDAPLAWLHAGETLSALWLQATVEGLSVLPLTQVVEVEETRVALRHDVLRDVAEPQLVLRVGWQEIGRRDLPRTPRRPLEDVLRESRRRIASREDVGPAGR